MIPQITPAELARFTSFVEKASGIYLGEKKKYLVENRLGRRIEAVGLVSFGDYLEMAAGSKTETAILLNAVTTNETSFFRNAKQYEAFCKVVAPEMAGAARNAGRGRLRIWSAACSTGEEAYTVAIVLAEQRLLPPGMTVDLVATDINGEVLADARAGRYKKYALRNTPQAYVDKYFTREPGDAYRIRTDLLPPVRFEQANLLDASTIAPLGNFDIVFCCNVLIYFGNVARTAVAANIYNAMNAPGSLFLGHAESLHNVSKDFKLVNAEGMPVYRKG